MSVNPEDLTWEIVANSKQSLAEAHRVLDEMFAEHHYVNIKFSAGKQRTEKQSRSLHLWCGWVADRLNEFGLDMRRVLKQEVDIPWTKESVKTWLWKPVQEAMINTQSTKDAERPDYSKIELALSRHFADKHGVTLPPWPKKEGEQ